MELVKAVRPRNVAKCAGKALNITCYGDFNDYFRDLGRDLGRLGDRLPDLNWNFDFPVPGSAGRRLGVTVEELTNAYATFAAGGKKSAPVKFSSVGNEPMAREEPPGQRRRTLSRLRRELRRIRARDYFPPPERQLAQEAVEELAELVEEPVA